ncbi:MAG: indole-3-glycerol phosphate synthase TrpC [Gemmatimonadota bacterium]|nr:MAG: indole-3-glycerol phosphate synthase TrpC [Gemmatimonadota bacterium]
MTTTLDSILNAARERVRTLKGERAALEAAARAAPRPPGWSGVFGGAQVAVIAEVKRRSPSAGAIAEGLEPADLARSYAAGGASAISVLTEGEHFGGSLADLEAVRRAVRMPVLRKDFVVDALQLYEARAAGASAVLLIVRALDQGRLVELAGAAGELGLGRLLEVHDASELERALAVEAESIGVNSRDLDDFSVDVARIEQVVRLVPPGVAVVAESGMSGRSDVEQVAAWGADAVLVGTALAGAADPEGAVRSLAGVARVTRGPR